MKKLDVFEQKKTALVKTLLIIIKNNNSRDVYLYIYWVSAYMR